MIMLPEAMINIERSMTSSSIALSRKWKIPLQQHQNISSVQKCKERHAAMGLGYLRLREASVTSWFQVAVDTTGPWEVPIGADREKFVAD